ncbi:MAG: hypothetical protein H0T64_02990 [Pyrinomonadaceae bacterium]|nr:hypothetical protein [Pyrinomonadaceae bacterium]
MDESFPTGVSIKAFYDGAKTRAKDREVDELKWVEIDGLKGVQFPESNYEQHDGSDGYLSTLAILHQYLT